MFTLVSGVGGSKSIFYFVMVREENIKRFLDVNVFRGVGTGFRIII